MVMICIAVRSTKSFQSITFAKQTSSCYQSDADRKIANVNQYKSIQTSLHAFDTTSAFESINSFYSTQPYFAAFLTCGLKSSVADLLVQGQGLGESRGKKRKIIFKCHKILQTKRHAPKADNRYAAKHCIYHLRRYKCWTVFGIRVQSSFSFFYLDGMHHFGRFSLKSSSIVLSLHLFFAYLEPTYQKASLKEKI